MMSYEDTNKKESKDDGLRFPALERSLLDEALSLLVWARTGALALSVNAKNDADADRLFNGLSTGGKVVMPLGKTFFSPRFGMTQDKFGVNWMVIVEPN